MATATKLTVGDLAGSAGLTLRRCAFTKPKACCRQPRGHRRATGCTASALWRG